MTFGSRGDAGGDGNCLAGSAELAFEKLRRSAVRRPVDQPDKRVDAGVEGGNVALEFGPLLTAEPGFLLGVPSRRRPACFGMESEGKHGQPEANADHRPPRGPATNRKPRLREALLCERGGGFVIAREAAVF